MLRKLIYGIIYGMAGIFILLFGAALYSKQSPGEVAVLLDQYNPIVPKSELYVKTTTPQSINEKGTALYQQTAANKDGKTQKVQFNDFNGFTNSKKKRYLKLIIKGHHVEAYEDVARSQVPEKALKKLDSR